jgi:hypothetical protein
MTAMVAVTLCSGDERSERALKSARPTWVAVPPLNRLEARAVFFGFLGARPDLQADDERKLDLLLQRAGGNPSLLRELAELCRCRLAEGKTLVQACRLLREVAYASWPAATRARWHTRVAEALSTATPGEMAAARGVELELATLDLRCGPFADAQRWAGGVADDPAAPSEPWMS